MTRPSSTPLRPLTVGEIVDRAASLYRREFRLLFTISFFLQLVIYLMTKGYTHALTSFAGGDPSAVVLVFFLLWPILMIVAVVVGCTATGALTWAATRRYMDENFGECSRTGCHLI